MSPARPPRPRRRRWRIPALFVLLAGTFALGVVASEPLRKLLDSVTGREPPAERPLPPPRSPAERAPGTPVTPPPGVDPEATETRFEVFSSDPGWDSDRSRHRPGSCATVRQDFGPHAGGAVIGGEVARTHRAAHYAKRLARPLSLDERFSFEGMLRFDRLSEAGSSGVLLGLFNRSAHDWRTPQSVVLRLFDSRSQRGKVSVAAEYGTRAYRTDQLAVAARGGVEDPDARGLVTLDARVARRFRLDYDPAAAGGRGRIVLSLEGAPKPVILDLLPGHRRDGAVLDRFGMLNQQHEVSGSMEAYFEDLRLNGAPVAAGPDWEANGNMATFRDCEVETYHDFGYQPRSEAAGGVVWRTDPDRDLAAWYGDGGGVSLDLDQELYASGRVRLARANSDSAVLLGWFAEDSEANEDAGPMHVPTNSVVMLVEGPSEVGWFARPVFGTEDTDAFGFVEGGPSTPTLWPGEWREFAIHYDPEAGESGEIAVFLDGRESRLPVSEDARENGADLDRFGIRSVEDDGHAMTPIFDDLTYTVEERD